MVRRLPLLLPLVATALAACSTTPVPLSEANFTADQYLYRTASADTAPVTVRRDRGFYGAACATRIYANGGLAARLQAGEAVVLNIPAGEVILGAEPGTLCPGNLVEREATLQAGKPVHFRVGIPTNGNLGLYRTMDK